MTLKDCDGCLVYGTDNRPLSRARVEISGEEVHLYFNNSKLRSIRVKTIVDFYDRQQGVLRSFCELVIKRNSLPSRQNEPWMADCEILNVQEIFQRQKDLRVKVNISAECMTDKGWFFSGTIQNISAGGLFLVTKHAMKPNDRFSFQHNFSSGPQKITAKVLRVSALMGGGFGYGCQFVNMSLDSETAVRKLVYTKQKEKLRKQ